VQNIDLQKIKLFFFTTAETIKKHLIFY